ncbi:hypothetical protein SAMN05192566_0771 [Methylophilus rhizosphaerae]|uniref:Uncharacterized protein n=1 Tax=Methylophilus rhizosphaerae TaxID=492660 RepID=A0A1G9A9S6_9PROT|nr:hypothetical protein [Methylophilus rhizosphaerae]SDK24122.1 hypothetical protein SAMN05192566_0771 [Methylophilus rhizosphaerae]
MSNQQTAQPQIKTLAELVADLSAAESKFKNGGYKDEDYKELKTIHASIQKFEQEKQANIQAIVTKINSYGFTLTDIFTIPQIKKAGFIKDPNSTESNGSGSGESANTEAYAYPSDKNQDILLKPATGQVGSREWTLKEGRIYEPLKGKGKKPFGQAIPKALTDAKTEQGILALATPYGKQYFATEKGKKELAEIVKVAQPPVKAK